MPAPRQDAIQAQGVIIGRHADSDLEVLLETNYDAVCTKRWSSQEHMHFVQVVFDNEVVTMICNIDPSKVSAYSSLEEDFGRLA